MLHAWLDGLIDKRPKKSPSMLKRRAFLSAFAEDHAGLPADECEKGSWIGIEDKLCGTARCYPEDGLRRMERLATLSGHGFTCGVPFALIDVSGG